MSFALVFAFELLGEAVVQLLLKPQLLLEVGDHLSLLQLVSLRHQKALVL